MLQLLASIAKVALRGSVLPLMGYVIGMVLASLVTGRAASPAIFFNAVLIVLCASALGTCIGMLIWGSQQNSKPPAKEG